MSLNRLQYDMCSYQYSLAESIGPGAYQLNTPENTCDPCHSNDPHIRLQSHGPSVSKDNYLIDVNSELLGISRNLSECPDKQFIPTNNPNHNSKVKINYKNPPLDYKNCFETTEDTRQSNPPSTLRGTGWNRWEWLPMNPQDKVGVPFDFEISSRIVTKDNHRPCVPVPLDQYTVYPTVDTEKKLTEDIKPTCYVPTGPPSVQWQNLSRIEKY